jgi:hypothetical protein
VHPTSEWTTEDGTMPEVLCCTNMSLEAPFHVAQYCTDVFTDKQAAMLIPQSLRDTHDSFMISLSGIEQFFLVDSATPSDLGPLQTSQRLLPFGDLSEAVLGNV